MAYLIHEKAEFLNVNLKKLQIDYVRMQVGDEVKDEFSSFDCFYFVAGGTGNVTVNGTVIDNLYRDSVFYVPKNANVVFEVGENTELEMYVLTMDVGGQRDFVKELGFNKNKLTKQLKGKIFIVEKLYNTANVALTGSSYRCVSYFYKILSLLMEENESQISKDSENNYVNRAVEFIHMQYYLDLNVQKLASMLYLNRSYFSTIFKKETGMSPMDYLSQYRIQQACQMLEIGKSITDTAMLTGFNSPSNFSVCFKKIKNMTPSEYKVMMEHNGESDEKN